MIGKGRETKERDTRKYIGVATCSLLAINPEDLQCEELGLENSPILSTVTIDDVEIPQVKVRMVMKSMVPEHQFLCNFILRKRYRYNKDKTKAQVIDKFGRTAWGMIDDIRAKRPLMSSKGTLLNIDPDYRPAMDGEAGLTEFIKTFLMIPGPDKWDSAQGKFVRNLDIKAEDCLCRLESWDAIFKGDLSEIVDAINAFKTNKIRIMFGIRNDMNTGSIYQTFYQNKFMYPWATSTKVWEKELAGLTGGNTEYGTYPLREYKVEATEIAPKEDPLNGEQESVNDLPF